MKLFNLVILKKDRVDKLLSDSESYKLFKEFISDTNPQIDISDFNVRAWQQQKIAKQVADYMDRLMFQGLNQDK